MLLNFKLLKQKIIIQNSHLDLIVKIKILNLIKNLSLIEIKRIKNVTRELGLVFFIPCDTKLLIN